MTIATFPTTASPRPEIARLAAATKRHGKILALDAVDLELYPREVLALLGPNGAGKTTLVNLLLGLARADSGEVAVFGREPREIAVRSRVGAMLQVSGVPPTLKVREHLELGSAYYPRPFPLKELLALAGLESLAERQYGQLSGGQKQRVLFALAVCGRPSLLFLDEPTVGLDVESRRALWGAIERLVEDGATILLTTHYLEEAERLAHRVAVLDRGRIVALGSPAEIKGKVAGRKILCRTRLPLHEIAALPGAGEVEQVAGRVEIAAGEPENLLRELLARDPGLAELEVRPLGLEEALRSLTSSRPLKAA
jgi:ABC-2 type transport system ATP-binding protein